MTSKKSCFGAITKLKISIVNFTNRKSILTSFLRAIDFFVMLYDLVTRLQKNNTSKGEKKLTTPNLLAKAIQIASKAHENQVDKANKPYILHPLRLMMKLENIDEQIVAVLHDVIEDSDTTLSDLRNSGFSEEIINAIDALTKKPGLDYQNYLEIISKNTLSRNVKIEDIKDNLNLTRLKNINDKDLERAQKYHKALKFLESTK